MEFRCSECGHIGPAETVRQTGDGVELECAECGATSPLDVEDEEDDAAEESASESEGDGAAEGAAPERPPESDAFEAAADVSDRGSGGRATFDAADSGGTSSASESQTLRVPNEEAVDRLVPETGPGLRCPKCAKLLPADADNCVRCGLDLAEGRAYDDGEAPWEQPPAGDEGEFERAQLLWETFAEEGDAGKLEEFVEFVEEENLYETAIRKIRFYLVDHPDDDAVHEALRELVAGVQSQLQSARAKAEVDAEELNEEIQSFKRKLILTVLGLWLIAVTIFVYIFWG